MFKLHLERLEDRLCLSAWQNPDNHLDVDGSGLVTPLDVLLVVDQLNKSGSQAIDVSADSSSPYYDTSGDAAVSPIDALLVINALNEFGNRSMPLVLNLDPAIDRNGTQSILVPVASYQATSLPLTKVRVWLESDNSQVVHSLQIQADNQGKFAFDVPLTDGLNRINVSLKNPLGVEHVFRRDIRLGSSVTEWNAAILNVVREWTSTSDDPYQGRIVYAEPPRVARNLAMIHLALFEAYNAVAQEYDSLLTTTSSTADASADVAAIEAAYQVAKKLYPDPDALRTWEATYAETMQHIGVAGNVQTQNGLALGRAIAQQILALRQDDGNSAAHEYFPKDEAGAWNRTHPGRLPPLLPQWRFVTPFALDSSSQFRPPPPPDLTSVEYAQSVDEVMRLGAANSTERTADQTEIAVFWADGGGTFTPPGHWNQIATDVLGPLSWNRLEEARLFALLNLALADAGISAWDAKYEFDFWRPIDAVRKAAVDSNSLTQADANWLPLLVSPPFPTYTSGHSTFSGAADAVLTQLIGSNIPFISSIDGHTAPGQRPLGSDLIVQRAFNSFSEAAEEAGVSRIYGGIHFNFDNVAGLEAGRAIGNLVVGRFLQPLGARA